MTCRAARTGELVGLAPFFSWRDGGARVLSLMGAGVSDYQDVLFEAAERDACVAALERWIGDTRSAWDRVEWSELPARSPLLNLSIEGGFKGTVSPQDVCPGLSLEHACSVEESLPRGRRQQLSYTRRRADRECGYEALVIDRDANLFEALFDGVERLHMRRWEPRGEPGVLSHPRVRSFQRAAARALMRQGRLMLVGIRLAGELAGVVYGFHDRLVSRCYLTGFEPRFAKHSPGLLAIGTAIEHAASRGAHVFDFLRGAEPYKYSWGARDLIRLYRRLDVARSRPVVCAAATSPTYATTKSNARASVLSAARRVVPERSMTSRVLSRERPCP